MKTNFDKQGVPFTIIANDVLCNPKLSAKSKGIYAYLYSKPTTWSFSADRISDEMEDSRESILSGLKELEEENLLKRIRHSDGRVTYWVTYPPNNFEPQSEKPTLGRGATIGKTHSGKTRLISNKEGCVPFGGPSVPLSGTHTQVIKKSVCNKSEKEKKVAELIFNLKNIPESEQPAYLKKYKGKLIALIDYEKRKVIAEARRLEKEGITYWNPGLLLTRVMNSKN
jgi:hypothetical protein